MPGADPPKAEGLAPGDENRFPPRKRGLFGLRGRWKAGLSVS